MDGPFDHLKKLLHLSSSALSFFFNSNLSFVRRVKMVRCLDHMVEVDRADAPAHILQPPQNITGVGKKTGTINDQVPQLLENLLRSLSSISPIMMIFGGD